MIASLSHATGDARRWTKVLAPYREPSLARGLAELAATALPFAALWGLMWLSLGHGYWLTLLLAVPTAGFLVRLFMIQHDCGHGSFFRRRWANDWLGRAIGVLTLTAYDHWRRRHAVHHATGGNLDRRGVGDVRTLTVAEFQRLPAGRRLAYRLTRHPLVVLGLGPVWVFVLKHRLPSALRTADGNAWRSVLGTNLAIAGLATAAAALVGWREFLLVQAPVTWLASTIGVWLFFVQHQFEGTHWEREGDWSFHDGALEGSSHLDLPPVLRWFTANIGVHHVHHLSARIPSYRLGEVLRDHPELRGVNRLTAWDSLRGMHLALWDEDAKRLVSFREARSAARSTRAMTPDRLGRLEAIRPSAGVDADALRRAVVEDDDHGGLAVAGGDLLRHEAEPSAEVAAASKGGAVADRRHHDAGHQRPDAGSAWPPDR